MDADTPTAEVISAIFQAGQRDREGKATTQDRDSGVHAPGEALQFISRLPVPWQKAA